MPQLMLTENKDLSHDLTCTSRQLKDLQYCIQADVKRFIHDNYHSKCG